MADAARRFRAEDRLATLTGDESADELFYELAAEAFDQETADRAMYARLLNRGRQRAAR